jgi:hypothetical protein
MKKILFAALLGIGLLACNTTPPAPEKPRNLAPSPFVGFWSSEDNDDQNTFSLRIWQSRDTLYGGYCSVVRDGEKIDCGIQYDDKWDLAFLITNPTESTFETAFRTHFSETYGRVRLTLRGDTIFWRMLEAPSGEHYALMQTTFVRGDTLPEAK